MTDPLGMNQSTARNRLVKDTLFRLAIESGHVCFRCGKPLDRETFSIEHKESWLMSADPRAAFFDQENIAFSHQACNYAAGGKGAARKYTPEEAAERIKQSKKTHWTSERRRDKYRRLGT